MPPEHPQHPAPPITRNLFLLGLASLLISLLLFLLWKDRILAHLNPPSQEPPTSFHHAGFPIPLG